MVVGRLVVGTTDAGRFVVCTGLRAARLFFLNEVNHVKSFLTGSRVYGTPTEKSDVDMCVLLTYEEIQVLIPLAGAERHASEMPKSVSLRFGPLNIIATYDEALFAEWKIGTEDLIAAKPVTRDQAIKHFTKIRGNHVVNKTVESNDDEFASLFASK